MKLSNVLSETYLIEQELSSGSGGVVYKAWHKRLRIHVVIKELNHSLHINEASRRNEAEALKRIKSLYIPRVLDFLSEDDRSFTIMEYIEGESFGNLLKKHGKFNQYRVIEWYGQIASALVELHEQDICHCDIKPSNIILTPTGKACLIDFNMAVVKGNDTHLISRSRGYASPEQYKLFVLYKNLEASSDDEVDWKLSDIHNLGAAMYHILTGKRMKYDAKGRVLKANFSKQIEISPCHFIIERSTHPNPANRFASAEALNNTIQSLLN